MKALFLALVTSLAFVAHGTSQELAKSATTDPTTPNHATNATDSPTATGPIFVVDYSNPNISPSHWTLTIRPDGSGHFRSEMGTAITGSKSDMRTPDVNRDVQLSPAFASSVFQTAQRHAFFNEKCESNLKVAFQGWKELSYSGPDGKGTCKFNYSKDHEIQSLGDNMTAVAETIVTGTRLEMLLQHDPLGLDKEIEGLVDAAQSGRAQQLCVIRPILERLAEDDHVLDLVRKRARVLLANATT
jgi:hypothetical protein